MLVYECLMIMLVLCKSSYARLTPRVLQRWSSTMWLSTTCPKEWWSSLVGIKISLYSMSRQPISCMSKLGFACIMTHHCMHRTRPWNVICVVLVGFRGGKGSTAMIGLWSIKSTCKTGKQERRWNQLMGLTMWPTITVSTWRGFTGHQESLCIHRSRAFQLMNKGVTTRTRMMWWQGQVCSRRERHLRTTW